MSIFSIYAVTRLGSSTMFREYYLGMFNEHEIPTEYDVGNIVNVAQIPNFDLDDYSQYMDSESALRERTEITDSSVVPSRPNAIIYQHHDIEERKSKHL